MTEISKNTVGDLVYPCPKCHTYAFSALRKRCRYCGFKEVIEQ